MRNPYFPHSNVGLSFPTVYCMTDFYTGLVKVNSIKVLAGVCYSPLGLSQETSLLKCIAKREHGLLNLCALHCATWMAVKTYIFENYNYVR